MAEVSDNNKSRVSCSGRLNVNPTDINIYRSIAGKLLAAASAPQLLDGCISEAKLEPSLQLKENHWIIVYLVSPLSLLLHSIWQTICGLVGRTPRSYYYRMFAHVYCVVVGCG